MSKWDDKAENYTRYTEGDDRFEAGVLKALDADFKEKRVLDIGCGTGVYTIRIAKEALTVDAIDSSKNMLKVLEEDASSLGLANINIEHSSWQDYKLPKDKYDFALCTMSPAVSNAEDFIKMDECAKTKIYLGWAGVRDNKILETLFIEHGAVYIPPNGAKQLEDWLIENNIKYRIEHFSEERVKQRSFEEALQNYTWHLEIRGLTPDKNKIAKVLQNFISKDKTVIEKTTSKMNLLTWK